jgi:hypothetical protein
VYICDKHIPRCSWQTSDDDIETIRRRIKSSLMMYYNINQFRNFSTSTHRNGKSGCRGYNCRGDYCVRHDRRASKYQIRWVARCTWCVCKWVPWYMYVYVMIWYTIYACADGNVQTSLFFVFVLRCNGCWAGNRMTKVNGWVGVLLFSMIVWNSNIFVLIGTTKGKSPKNFGSKIPLLRYYKRNIQDPQDW